MTLTSIDLPDNLSIEKLSPQTDLKENPQRLKLEKSLEPTRAEIMNHRLYEMISNEKQICTFMEYHIFSVWDFQSLIKSLQKQLTCVSTPWLPTKDTEARRLMNEIILDEESGPHPEGGFASHFELYLDAMQSAGADTSKIHALLKALEEGKTLEESLDYLPGVVSDYLKQTFGTIQGGDLTELMASFCYGREDIIPDMFRRLITNLSEKNPTRWEKLGFYFTEHIDCDETRHGPMARAMLERHCSNDLRLWGKAEQSAKSALIQRKNFWDGILVKIESLD